MIKKIFYLFCISLILLISPKKKFSDKIKSENQTSSLKKEKAAQILSESLYKFTPDLNLISYLLENNKKNFEEIIFLIQKIKNLKGEALNYYDILELNQLGLNIVITPWSEFIAPENKIYIIPGSILDEYCKNNISYLLNLHFFIKNNDIEKNKKIFIEFKTYNNLK